MFVSNEIHKENLFFFSVSFRCFSRLPSYCLTATFKRRENIYSWTRYIMGCLPVVCAPHTVFVLSQYIYFKSCGGLKENGKMPCLYNSFSSLIYLGRHGNSSNGTNAQSLGHPASSSSAVPAPLNSWNNLPLERSKSKFASLTRLFKPWKWRVRRKSDKLESVSQCMIINFLILL